MLKLCLRCTSFLTSLTFFQFFIIVLFTFHRLCFISPAAGTTESESAVDRTVDPAVKQQLVNIRGWRGFNNPWMPADDDVDYSYINLLKNPERYTGYKVTLSNPPRGKVSSMRLALVQCWGRRKKAYIVRSFTEVRSCCPGCGDVRLPILGLVCCV
jgi:hypothetical protein